MSVIKASIYGNSYVGIFGYATDSFCLIGKGTPTKKMEQIKKALDVEMIELTIDSSQLVGIYAIVNDKIAIINPGYTKKEENIIRDTLDVEVIKMSIGGFNTVGANNIMTNKGIVFNNRIKEEEIERLEEAIGLTGEQSTANLGSLNIGLSTIANSKGLVVGETTTGYELARIANSLNL